MRHRQWTLRLPETLRAAMSRPFLWGEHDCCLFAADCVQAVCDFDPCETVRGRYSTHTGAAEVLKSEFGTLEQALDRLFDRTPVTAAGRGDIVMFEAEEGKTLGVLWAGKIWAVTRVGVRPVDVSPLTAWRVE
ncbi:DUF6950 family protein [Xenorhabdus griffiniae]|uniref:DUF6950 domain-containing protein n=1 Tax=Xenorhabdus griffiniae TaxID=351672 RepID=A0ABY9XFG7_9GAMM|nr:hypothetical protein [Xenorhabdus griffiniae]MBD1229395.1 hypothetical protein [Xenorhabdus griffiniae]MBE8589129.1 hypothetical protein [Xenorhabdus griffiniae]WMV71651.1 hypothetical protein QL128_16135 [Xenorhabdus griffiniae]WNH01328.1 hypothetical protein QL112_016140 [Xenorhabdus griffiniae]